MLDAALQLPTRWPSTPLRPRVFHCLFGLLSVTGLRISEALDLRLDDVDLEQAVLTIRIAKLDRSRLVPIHPTTRDVLADYLQRRERFLGARARPTCSSLTAVPGSISGACIARSMRCRARRVCARPARAGAQGCTTSGIAWPSRC